MNIAIIEVRSILTKQIDAHIRNAIIIYKYLKETGHDVVLMGDDTKPIEKKYDVIIYSYASFYFDFKKYENLIKINNNSKFVWITNEYNLSMNTFMRKTVKNVISNFSNNSTKKYNNLVTNLNTLLFKENTIKLEKKYDLCYYGTFRPDRIDYFKKYLKKDLILSTSSKNHKLFKDIGCTCKFTDKFAWKDKTETLRQFKASLYIEDKYTHECYNFLANRFYEALSFDNAIFFDTSCYNTMIKSNYKIDNFFVVSDYEGIIEKINSKEFEEKKNEFIKVNSKIAIDDRKRTLNDIGEFLNNLI